MKKVNSKRVEKIWYLTTKEQVAIIESGGVFNTRGYAIMIHKTTFGMYGEYSDDQVSVFDYFAACTLQLEKDLEYVVLELDPDLIKDKLKANNTRGEVMSECAFVYTGESFDTGSIINISKKKLDLMNLFYFNSIRLRWSMFKNEIQNDSGVKRDAKTKIKNNRIIDEKHEVLWFNEMMIVRYANKKVFSKEFHQM